MVRLIHGERQLDSEKQVLPRASPVRSLYPSLTIDACENNWPICNAPAEGIELGCLISQEAFLEARRETSRRYIVLARKPRSELLSFAASLAGVICLKEDPSSHFSIICRSNGTPIAVIDEEDFASIVRHIDRDCAIDTLSKSISIGQISIDRTSHVAYRKEILDKINGCIEFSISSNADTAQDLNLAVASGFKKSWPRSETLLYAPDTLLVFRSLLFKPTQEMAEQFSLQHQKAIRELMKSAKGNRVALRLLDPPAHEFLPQANDQSALAEIAQYCALSLEELASRTKALIEQNPMIGHRGCRLLLTHPTILEAQIRAIVKAWLSLDGHDRPPYVEIFVPFVVSAREVMLIKERITAIAATDPRFDLSVLKFGAMIETPSIFDDAPELARLVDFVSYGTNDLSATYYALSRGDCYTQFLTDYVNLSLFECDPLFELTDVLTSRIIHFSQQLRAIRPDMEIDVCGEHTLGANIWRAVRCGAFSSISVGVGNLPQLLERMQDNGILDQQFRPISDATNSDAPIV